MQKIWSNLVVPPSFWDLLNGISKNPLLGRKKFRSPKFKMLTRPLLINIYYFAECECGIGGTCQSNGNCQCKTGYKGLKCTDCDNDYEKSENDGTCKYSNMMCTFIHSYKYTNSDTVESCLSPGGGIVLAYIIAPMHHQKFFSFTYLLPVHNSAGYKFIKNSIKFIKEKKFSHWNFP